MNLGIQSLLAQNASAHCKTSGTNKAKSTKRLSSGYKINSAADDAAGLSISEKMRKQIRGLNKASRNVEDGISYVQVADGALAEVQSMLHRMNELSVQASNDTNTASDRLAIDNEIQKLKKEINRVFSSTEFNTKKVWDTEGCERVQIGTEPVQAAKVNSGWQQNIAITESNKWLIAESKYIIQANAKDGIKVSWTAYNGKEYATNYMQWPEKLAGTNLEFNIGDYLQDEELKNSGINFRLSYSISDVATVDDVVKSIDGTVLFSTAGGPTRVGVQTKSGNKLERNGVSVSFSSHINYEAQLAADRKFDIDVIDSKFMEPSSEYNFQNPETDTDTWKINFTIKNDAASNKYNVQKDKFTGTAISESTYYKASTKETNNPNGNYWWYLRKNSGKWDVYVPSYSPEGEGGTPMSIKNALTNPGAGKYPLNSTEFGGTITIRYEIEGNYSTPNGDKSDIGTLDMELHVKPTTSLEEIRSLLDDVKSIEIFPEEITGVERIFGASTKACILDKPIYESQINLNIQTSDQVNDHIAIQYKSLRLENLGLKETNTTTYEDSQNAMTAVGNALSIVSDQRSLFGAYQNRLESARNVIENTEENTQRAESRLRDSNMADEIVEFSKHNILEQAGAAMISQANSNLSQVMNLLQNG